MLDKIEKLNLDGILEGKTVNEGATGTWVGDELVVRTFPITDLVDRIVLVGYNFKGAKKMEDKLRKVLPGIIKKDRNYAMATIDILADKSIDKSDIADLVDQNVDEFIESHAKELSAFKSYERGKK